MARTNLPGNILKSLNTRLLGNLKSGVDTNIDLMNAQTAAARQGVQDYADISAQDFLSDVEAVNTGDPAQDLLMRNQLVQQMKADPGLIDMGKVNVGLRDIRKQAPIDYLKGQEAKKEFKTQHDIDWDTDRMRNLPNRFLDDGSVNPAFQTSIESNIAEARRNNIAIPQEKALYRSIFDNDPFTFKPDTITTLDNLVKGGAKKFTKDQQASVINKIADNMAKKYPGITDRSVFKTRAGTLLANSKYGEKFRLGLADEATGTIDTLEVERIQNVISDAAQARDNKAYTAGVNQLLGYMNRNNISGDHPLAKSLEAPVLLALQHDGKTLDNFIKENSAWETERKQGLITVNTEQNIKNKILAHYQKTFPELTEGIFEQRYDKLKNKAGGGISAAIALGRKKAEMTAKAWEEKAESGFKTYKENVEHLRKMGKIGVAPTIVNTITDKFKKEFGEEWTPTDSGKLKTQIREVVNRFKTHIGKGLKGDEKDAFQLAVRNMLVQNTTWSPKWLKGIMSPEFGLPTKGWGAWNDMTDIQHLRAYELLQESIPDPREIRKATGNERKIRDSIIKFNDTLQRKIDELKSERAVQSAKTDEIAEVLLTPAEIQNPTMSVQNLDTMNKLANQ